MPDRLLLGRWGGHMLIEFKRPGGDLSEIQKHWRKFLMNRKHRVGVCDSRAGFRLLLKIVDTDIGL